MIYEKSIFIITYGRSGSTLLQGILNSIDGYEIKGEHYSALVPLFHSYIRIKRARYQQGGQIKFSTDPWFGSDELLPRSYGKSLVKLFVEEILKPDLHSRVIGFKEIRYDFNEFETDNHLKEYLYFLKEFFPNAKFIFNERDIYNTAKSAWWKRDEKAVEKIEAILSRMKIMYEEFKTISYWIKYDEYSSDIKELKPLFNFLNEVFDEEQLMQVLNVKHSY
ncbi:MAG: hypothetical protein DRI84_09925 [Bacteroidetes bacterium]|nr:MAG: hypothetical protein DRI84_09925 [Bacteroidota bacterium]